MSTRGRSKKGSSKGKGNPKGRTYPKYDRNFQGPESVYATMSPSTLAMSVRSPLSVSKKTAPVPEMIEFLDIRSSTQPNSYVSVDEPLFQPLESTLVFGEYEPFRTYTKRLYFRNNDNVARRMKILPSDSPYFSVSAPQFTHKTARKDGSVAAGMELCFDVTFKPQEKRSYSHRLICVTEREKFVVPVVAMGTVACLDFQDHYDFGDVPCKSASKQTFTVRNTGTAPAHFSLSTNGPFKATCQDSFVPIGGSTLVELEFCPQESRDFSGELIITYSDDSDKEEKVSAAETFSSLGRTVHVDLTGTGTEVEVGMVTSSLAMDDTYISLSSHKVVKLFNRSGIPVKYSWKAFATKEEEQQERERLISELDRMEDIEREDLLAASYDADDSDLSSDEEADDANGGGGAAKAAALSALSRKYKNLRKAANDAPFHFVADDNFTVDPVEGELWPNSEVEVVVSFLPSIASEYRSEVFLDITGQEHRATLDLRGIGIGPKAMFSYDVLDIGDVFLGSQHKYKLSLQNQGDIPAQYQLQPRADSQFQGPIFKFSPESGTLAVGDTHVIDIDFSSDVLGEFSEQFTFNLRGSSECLSVHFKGHVVGPTFHFDAEELDFGRVSFEFLHSKNLCLYNTSEIPMEFKLRVPQDGKAMSKEFDIIPASGSVLPGGKQPIRIDFISTTAKVYEYFLTVDVKGVGEGLCSIPILAECGVPEVKLLTPQLEYEQCFLRHPYHKDIVLKNESDDLRARFEILAQDKHSKAIAEYTTPTQRGIIEPSSELAIDISLVCNRLGNVKLPIYVRISGSEKPPLLPVVHAVSIGPVISADLEVMDWRKIPCLQYKTLTLRITNDSLIPAPYQCHIKNLRSKFSVGPPPEPVKKTSGFLDDDDDAPPALGAGNKEPEQPPGHGVLEPGASTDIVVACNLDDTTLHKDTLTILVTEGEPLSVGLVARGTGTTMHCDEDLSIVDFGFQFTNGTCSRKFLLENKGRRSQSLNWVNTTIKEAIAQRRKEEHQAKLDAMAAEKAGKKRRKKKKPPKEIKAVFNVSPESIELKPRTACYFEFTGAMTSPSQPEEVLVCEARVGNEQKGHPVFHTVVRANFIDPLLEPSTRSMSFEYTYEEDVPLTFQRQPLTLKNISELPLDFTLKTQVPFNVDSYEFSLQPGESASLNVEFDPGYNDDRTSCHVDGQVTIVYAGHPQRDTVSVSGTVNFPNLEFDFREVDFGCVLNDTATSAVVRITNVSTIDVDFQWIFIEDEDEQRSIASAKKPFIPIKQAFDILPIRGALKPGEYEDVEVVFYGHANRSFTGLAVCEVEGGPEYEVTLKGEASDIQYSVDVSELDFGNVIHNKYEERDFSIINLGKVPFNFRFDLSHISGPHQITVSPMQGRIFEKDRQKVVVKFSPQVPQEIVDKIVVEVAHFEAIDIPLTGSGIFAQVVFSLPLVEPQDWPRLMEEASSALAAKAQKRQATSDSAAVETASVVPPETPKKRTKKRQGKGKGKTADELLLLDTEMEARRRYFMEYLLNIVETEGSLDSMRPSTKSSRKKPSGGSQSSENGPKTTNDFVIAEHLADFGNVIAGTSKKKTFRVTNLGSIPVSFSLDKRLPAAHGFTVEPEKVNRLPEGTSVDFTLKFKARKNGIGPVEVDVPIDVKGGPTAQLSLRANVTVPDIVIAPNKVDFGDVVVGQCKVVTVQVTNTAPVAAEWVIKHLALTGAAAKSAARFSYEPDHGTLRPGERQNVRVTFTPTGNQGYAYTVPFRIANNPAQKLLEVAGTGQLLALSFDPPHIVLPTVRPYDPPVRQTVEVVNNSEYPIEVFSLDFDKQYLEEEAAIQQADFDESGQMLLAPREPGSGLPIALLPAEQAEEARIAAEIQPFQRKHATDFLVIGPGLCGKSTMAQRLGEKYNIPVVSIAQVMASASPNDPDDEPQQASAEGDTPEALTQALEENLWRYLHRTNSESQWGLVIDGVDNIPGVETPQIVETLVRVFNGCNSKRFQVIQLQFQDPEIVAPTDGDGDVETKDDGEPLSEPRSGLDVHIANVTARLNVRSQELDEQLQAAQESLEQDREKLAKLQSEIDAAQEAEKDDEDEESGAEESPNEKSAALRDEYNVLEAAVSAGDERQAALSAEKAAVLQLLERVTVELTSEAVEEFEVTRATMVDSLAPLICHQQVESTEAAEDVSDAGDDKASGSVEDGEHAAAAAVDPSKLVTVNAAQESDIVFASIGIELEGNVDVPQQRSELDIIPEPETLAIVRRGVARLPATPLTKFAIENPYVEPEPLTPEEEAAIAKAKAAEAKARAKKGLEPEPEPEVQHATRWILPPHGSAAFDVVFQSDGVGSFDVNMGFEIVGDSRQFVLTSRGICSVPSVNTDARNVFMNRVKGGRPENISHKYVTSRERFEFGPLLVGKPEDKGAQTVIRLSNNSDFPVDAQLSIFEDAADAKKAPKSESIPFSIEPQDVQIAPGETQEVIVRAFPSEPGEVNHQVICCIRDNPDPVTFNVNCIGAAPILDMSGPWEQDSEEGESLPNDVDGLIDFKRLLVNRMEEQSFTLRNGSAIPVRWRVNTDSIAEIPELTVSPAEGVLDPDATVYVTVTFRTTEEELSEVTPVLAIEYADNEVPPDAEDEEGVMGGGGSEIQTLQLQVKAEAYKIDPSLGLTDENGNDADKLVFGPTRVNEMAEHTVTLGNNGKYDLSYEISCQDQEVAELFTITPPSGVLAAGSKAEVSIQFQSQTEVHLKNNKDIQVKIIEVMTGEVESEFDITVDADAEFSKLRLQPLRGLNFGALRFGNERTRNFELRNDGIFPFTYKIVVLPSASADIQAAVEAASAVDSLSEGPFTITPASGEVLPNATQTISAQFDANGAEVFKSLFFIEVSNQDNRIDPRVMMYELVGESCIPGINVDDYLSIFEEQDVVHKLDPDNHTLRAFSMEDRTFTFGAVIPASYPDGLRERFKVTNVTKVRATARFAIEGGEDAAAFTIQPATADFPPHEHRYISVYFKPTKMKSYSAVFKAVVDDGEDAGSNTLQFDLHGDGAMPSVAITKPLARDAETGNVVMDFARTHLGKSVNMEMTLQNDGIVPSTVTFAMSDHPDFTLSARGTSVQIAPGASHTVQASFRPNTIAPDESGAPRDECDILHKFVVNVLNNKFEQEEVILKGVAFQDRITFDDLPHLAQDELAFEDVDISAEDEGQQIAFGIKNHSDAVVRFEWSKNENFSFSPSIGHIPVGATKEVTASFVSNGVAANYDKVPVELSYTLVTLEEGALDDWDDTQKVVRYDEDQDEQIKDVVEEPNSSPFVDPATGTESSERTSILYCTAHADRVTYECDCPSVLSVRDTMMFQSRKFSFVVSNTCDTALSFNWGELTNNGTAHDLLDVACPFKIEPSVGKVPPNGSQPFTLTFSPLEAGIFAYRANCSINNLADDMKPLTIQMSGRGVRPVCHFDLPASSYLVRRKANLPGPNGGLGPLDPAIRVAEVSSLGVKVKNRLRFVAINPMNNSYEFKWEPIGVPNSVFRCLTQRGIIPAGKRFEMSFEFTPVELTGQAQESFWRFSIPQRNVSATFLVVGEVKEPRVTMDTSHINFRQLLLGAVAHETVHLVNHEHLPFQFAFEDPAVDSEGHAPVTVEPMRGVVSANSSADIKVVFKPTAEKDYNANLVCDVRGKPGPLALNVKGEGYAVHEGLTLVDGAGSDNHDVTTINVGKRNIVDFGDVQINGDCTKKVVLSNTGRIHYEYLFSRIDNPFVTITPSSGTVRRGEKVECELKFHPTRDCKLRDVPLTCTIARARKYTMKMSGRGVKAALQFSFREYSFPPCFVGVADGERHAKRTVLHITNNEPEHDVSLDCLFERTPVLDVTCHPTVLRPHESLDIPVVFTPRAVQQYNMAVTFEVNGLYKVPVLFKGEGIALCVELVEPVMRDQDFGSVKPHQEVVKRVRLMNKSKQTASFELLESEVAGEGQLSSRSISFWPRGVQSLPPRGKIDVELRFSPTHRIPAFRQNLLIKAEGSVPENLITITGACVGIDVHIDTDCIPFGKVGERSKVVRKLRMENSGDVGTRYAWNASAFGPHFSISPSEGYLGPHADITFDVTFHPAFVNDDIRNEGLLCQVEGMSPLPLTLTGKCVEGPTAEELRFETKVRESTSAEVELSNPSRVAWHIRPSFEHAFFSGPDILEIPAGKSAKYTVTYTPLTMTERPGEEEGTVRHEAHEGSLFFGLPDGTTRQWKLFGQSNRPSALPLPEDIVLSAPAKTTHSIHLPIVNWLASQQRFEVAVDVQSVEGSDGQKSVFVTAAKNVAVPPSSRRNFKLSFFAYTAGKTNATVKFTNAETQEYFFYELEFEATAPGVWDRVPLQTMCRQSAKHIIHIENPAPENGKIELPGGAESGDWWTCSSEEVRVREITELCGPAESSFEIEYRPVAVAEGNAASSGGGGSKGPSPTTAELEIDCGPVLGKYKYELSLVATPPGIERTLHFKAPLGGTQTKPFRFNSILRSAGPTFSASVEKPLFFNLDTKSVSAPAATTWEGAPAEINVIFEPEQVGKVTDTLTLSSPNGGIFRCTLIGECTAPTPQGPFELKKGSSVQIPFKNVFNEKQAFDFSIDTPSLFSVSPAQADLAPKSSTTINVTFTGTEDGTSATGRLLVTPRGNTTLPPWIFYLSGQN